MIFLNKTLLTIFIKNLNVESYLKYLNYLGFQFNRNEVEVILPYLKNNIEFLDKEHKLYLLKNLPPVSSYCKYQLSLLFDRFI